MTQAVSPLKLENALALMRKISLNVLNKDAHNTLFTLPIEGIALGEEQLDAFMGAYTFRSWYEQRKDNSWMPMPWWSRRAKADFPIEDEFDCESLTIEVSGEQELEFESEESDDDDGEARPAARITSVVLTPQAGGMTLLAFHLQVRPDLGQTNLALQEHQFRHVKITLGDTTVAARKPKQQSLRLEPATKVTPETDAALDKAIHRPGPVESTSGEQIDAELHARHPELAGEVMGADVGESLETGTDDAPRVSSPQELSEFESAAAAQVAAFNAKPGEVIDGRSERVKHQDQQKARSRGGKRSEAH